MFLLTYLLTYNAIRAAADRNNWRKLWLMMQGSLGSRTVKEDVEEEK